MFSWRLLVQQLMVSTNGYSVYFAFCISVCPISRHLGPIACILNSCFLSEWWGLSTSATVFRHPKCNIQSHEWHFAWNFHCKENGSMILTGNSSILLWKALLGSIGELQIMLLGSFLEQVPLKYTKNIQQNCWISLYISQELAQHSFLATAQWHN